MCQNPSYEVDHLDKEYKGRNGTPWSVSKPDVRQRRLWTSGVTNHLSLRAAFQQE